MTDGGRDDRYDAGALTVQAAVREFGIGRTKLFELVKTGHLPVARVGRRTLIPRRGLADLLSRLTAPVTPAGGPTPDPGGPAASG